MKAVSKKLEEISIHAPARGATYQLPFSDFRTNISIHAPARGATGMDQLQGGSPAQISIHAPARGATAVLAKNLSLFSAKTDK